ncbi:unnamed protein product [Prorocentrum cordatum]|uniref:Protein kinase domain-containing protein n=1 Tax=Prorocentrum cordatum TaxID=2364126 RepID=A0ABN9QRT3_9DINO|nr:unnamed protein product [Polarella glacialis]
MEERRAEGRTAQRLLAAFMALDGHRGCQPTLLGAALAEALRGGRRQEAAELAEAETADETLLEARRGDLQLAAEEAAAAALAAARAPGPAQHLLDQLRREAATERLAEAARGAEAEAARQTEAESTAAAAAPCESLSEASSEAQRARLQADEQQAAAAAAPSSPAGEGGAAEGEVAPTRGRPEAERLADAQRRAADALAQLAATHSPKLAEARTASAEGRTARAEGRGADARAKLAEAEAALQQALAARQGAAEAAKEVKRLETEAEYDAGAEKQALEETGLGQVFVATDAPEDLREELRAEVRGAVHFYADPGAGPALDHPGKQAAAEIWIAARAEFFIGTQESRFTMAIQLERGFLGKRSATSEREFCKVMHHWLRFYRRPFDELMTGTGKSKGRVKVERAEVDNFHGEMDDLQAPAPIKPITKDNDTSDGTKTYLLNNSEVDDITVPDRDYLDEVTDVANAGKDDIVHYIGERNGAEYDTVDGEQTVYVGRYGSEVTEKGIDGSESIEGSATVTRVGNESESDPEPVVAKRFYAILGDLPDRRAATATVGTSATTGNACEEQTGNACEEEQAENACEVASAFTKAKSACRCEQAAYSCEESAYASVEAACAYLRKKPARRSLRELRLAVPLVQPPAPRPQRGLAAAEPPGSLSGASASASALGASASGGGGGAGGPGVRGLGLPLPRLGLGVGLGGIGRGGPAGAQRDSILGLTVLGQSGHRWPAQAVCPVFSASMRCGGSGRGPRGGRSDATHVRVGPAAMIKVNLDNLKKDHDTTSNELLADGIRLQMQRVPRPHTKLARCRCGAASSCAGACRMSGQTSGREQALWVPEPMPSTASQASSSSAGAGGGGGHCGRTRADREGCARSHGERSTVSPRSTGCASWATASLAGSTATAVSQARTLVDPEAVAHLAPTSHALEDFDGPSRPLGSGSFGAVWRVEHRRTGEVFAMKVIRKDRVELHGMAPYLLREVKTQLKITHPHVLRLFQYFEDDADVRLLLEYAAEGAARPAPRAGRRAGYGAMAATAELEHFCGYGGAHLNTVRYHPLQAETLIYTAASAVIIEDVNDPHKQEFLRGQHDNEVSALDVSANGKLLASGQLGSPSRKGAVAPVAVWDFDARQVHMVFEGLAHRVLNLRRATGGPPPHPAAHGAPPADREVGDVEEVPVHELDRVDQLGAGDLREGPSSTPPSWTPPNICTEILEKNPRDQAVWFLKCRALTRRQWLDDVEIDEEGIADILMDDNAVAQAPRPGTSLHQPLARGPEAGVPSQVVRPVSAARRPVTGFARPGTNRPTSSAAGRDVATAMQGNRPGTSRPLTSMGRLVRLGTASMQHDDGGEFVRLDALDLKKYAQRPAIAKALCDYMLYYAHNPRKALELASEATQASDFNDWWWKARLGKAYYQLGLLRDAEKQLKSALRDQDIVTTHLELCKIYLKLDQPNTALDQYTRASEKWTGDTHLLVGIARTWDMLNALLRGVQFYKKVLHYDSVNVEAIACLASHHFYTDQPELALRFYRRLLQNGVANAELWNNMGLCCFYAGQYDLTLSCFERALMLADDDNMAEVWYNIGQVAIGVGDLGLAYQAFKIAVSVDPNHAESYSNLGVLELRKNNVEQAQAHFHTAMRLGPHLFEPAFNGGLLAFKLGDFQESYELAHKALEAYPDHIDSKELIKQLKSHFSSL